MLSFHNILPRSRWSNQKCRHISNSLIAWCKDDKLDDDPQPQVTEKEAKSRAAREKLNKLLHSMVEEESTLTVTKQLDLAKPREIYRTKKMMAAEEEEKAKAQSLENRLKAAAKDVAEKLKGDPKVTESELLERLLSKDKPTVLSEEKKSRPDLSELIAGMKIDHSEQPKMGPESGKSRASQVRDFMKRERPERGDMRAPFSPDQTDLPMRRTRATQLVKYQPIDLFGAEPFGIFKQDDTSSPESTPELKVWQQCKQKELRLSVSQLPTNIYEQIIQWTDRGIFWKFPIDNEQGLEEEHQTDFTEHIFLETHLEDWCPPTGPIHHFMELVCIGLSKNHWMTVKEKKGHILWYRNYFSEKSEMLKELGAGDIKQITEASAAV